ncbi:MAG TPA: glycosyltransferase family 2 protein [Gemmatimonadaceae bacterium]|nr:glycosyltransferase family 2 protein [Gemmatimonadaceae bacterium]
MKTAFRLSVAIPLHNEEAGVPELLRRLGAVLESIPGGPHEMVLVDDGSRDRTLELLQAAARRDPQLVIVALSRNFGHQAALSAALDYVSGDVVVAMDGDLQDRPEAIPALLAKHHEGFDVVYAQRVKRKESWPLRLSYFVFYRMLASLADTKLPLDSGDFALMSRQVVDQMRAAPEHNRYLRGLRSWVGFRQTGVVVERDERFAGTTNYGPIKLLKLASDGLFSFSIVPLRAAAMLGLVAILLSTAFSIYTLYAKLFLHRAPVGFTSIMLFMSFLTGVQLFFLGIIGEYIGRIYQETKRRPLYVVGSVVKHGAGMPVETHRFVTPQYTPVVPARRTGP